MKRLLVTGASGFLGHALCLGLRTEYELHGLYRSHRPDMDNVSFTRCDITDQTAVAGVFADIRPDAVIHAAALSSTNYCQEHPGESRAVNVDASRCIAGLCADRTLPLVFTSSDMVFDGRRASYGEDDPPCPVNLYGEHKVLAEQEILARHPGAVVARLALLYGPAAPFSGSFLQPMLAAMRSRQPVNLFIDEHRTPLSAADAVLGLQIALQISARDPGGHRDPGIVHLAGPERLSRYAFGLLVQETFGLPEAKLVACLQRDVAMTAPRPPDLALSIDKARSLGFKPGGVRQELTRLALADRSRVAGPSPVTWSR